MSDRDQDRIQRLAVAILDVEPIVALVAAFAAASFGYWIVASQTMSVLGPYRAAYAGMLLLPAFVFFVDLVSFATGREMPYSEALWG